MGEVNTMRLNKVLREFNISLDRAMDFLKTKGVEIEARPTTKISEEVYQILFDEFQTDKSKKVASKEVSEEKKKEKEELRLAREKEQEEKQKAAEAKEKEVVKAQSKLDGPKTVGKIDLDAPKKEQTQKEEKPIEEKPAEEKQPEEKVVEKKKPVEEKPKEEEKPKADTKKTKEDTKQAKPKAVDTEEKEGSTFSETKYTKLNGPNFTGEKIDLDQFKKSKKKTEKPKPGASKDSKDSKDSKGKRKRIAKEPTRGGSASGGASRGKASKGRGRQVTHKEEPSEEEVQKQIKETLEKLQGKSSKGKAAKYRRDKRDTHRQKSEDEIASQEAQSKVLQVTEFVSVNELSTLMNVPVTDIISACMTLGMMVTMNQRLDAETLSIVADEFGYEVKFVTADDEDTTVEEVINPEDLEPRAPIVTVMGHVDHGKTSLLDYIRQENVIAGESGGITQHIGAYAVQLENGQKITFLDTPGHEAFTAMRARGAKVTDLAIIVVAADDDVMPQTKEAISHAQAAGVPIVFAINKIDRPEANPEKIKEKLAGMNLLVEDWGGKIQSHDISAKQGTGVKELLEKVLLEAELLELKANPNKLATGTVVEAFLDKGRGYVSTILVQSGTLNIGDYILAGQHSGKVKAMHDERGHNIKSAGPATPVSVLGIDGAPQAGDKFAVYEDEREAKAIATKRTQLQREQSVRTQRHITLDEIGRRIALGDFKELNVILKADVDGSVEALTDSFQKLSTEEIQINIIHKAVGPITESDVLLASASDAVIIGFNVRPMGNARQIADKEEIDIRMYSI
ncbi:translation initiation factor IF-2, partial [uncultured Planktosalinus sp.]|uniref:translation initiation factor IF-2 n=1 Tax=uncultured Planktosalinus sp. TaxID=1810935 RepID=UPI0030D7EF1A